MVVHLERAQNRRDGNMREESGGMHLENEERITYELSRK